MSTTRPSPVCAACNHPATDSPYCRYCGAPAAAAAIRSTEPEPAATPQAVEEAVVEPEPATVEKEAESPGRPKPRRARRIMGMIAALVLVLAGTFGGGIALGYRLAVDDVVAAPEGEVVTVEVPDYAPGSEASMPDVRGLARDDSLAALVDAGIPQSIIQVQDRPAAGPSGLVVEQAPAFGAERPDAVTLWVSSPSVVPAVVGTTEASATNALEELGARVVVTRSYTPGADTGSVVATQPEPGSALPDEVTIDVAEAPGAIYLDAVTALDGGCSSGPADVNGATLEHAVVCRTGSAATEVSYVLRRAVSEVRGTVGVPDSGPADAAVRVQVSVDGATVTTVTARYGAPAALDLSARDGLRLTFQIIAEGVDPNECCTTIEAVLGDVQLVGSADGVRALAEGP